MVVRVWGETNALTLILYMILNMITSFLGGLVSLVRLYVEWIDRVLECNTSKQVPQ